MVLEHFRTFKEIHQMNVVGIQCVLPFPSLTAHCLNELHKNNDENKAANQRWSWFHSTRFGMVRFHLVGVPLPRFNPFKGVSHT